MRRLISLVLSSLALLAALAPARAGEPASGEAGSAFQTSAPIAYLIDPSTGTVLFSKGAETLYPPASTAKIMTAEVVFHEIAQGRLKLDDSFVVSEHAWRTGGAPSGGSAMFAALGSRIRVEDLIRGLVVASGNDAAIVLAEGIAGSEEKFATLMNQRARDIGLTRSNFTNPWGRGDPEQKVTARDMAVLSDYIVATYPQFYPLFGVRDFTWNRVHQYNRNPLLTMNVGADGLKTGDLEDSGYGLVGSAVQNGERLTLVLAGARTARDRASESFKLLAWGFRAFEPKTLYAPGETIGSARVYGGTAREVPLVASGAIVALLPRGAGGEKLTGKIVYKGPLRAPVAAGSEVGEIEVFRGGAEILSAPLKTAEAVGIGTLPHRAADAGYEFVTNLVRQNFEKR